MTRALSIGGLTLTVILLTAACGTKGTTAGNAQAPLAPPSASESTPATTSAPQTTTPGPARAPHGPSPSGTPATSAPTRSAASPTGSRTWSATAASGPTATTTSRWTTRAPATTAPPRPAVPNVVGMTYTEAKSRLQGAGDKYFVLCGGGPSTDANGIVYSQSPAGGSASAGSTLVEISVTWAAPIDPSSAPPMRSGPIAQKPCPYS